MRKPNYAARGSKVVEADEWVQFLSLLSKDMFLALNPGMAGISNFKDYNIKAITLAPFEEVRYPIPVDTFLLVCNPSGGVLRLEFPSAKNKMFFIIRSFAPGASGTLAIYTLGGEFFQDNSTTTLTISPNTTQIWYSDGDKHWFKV